MARGTTSQRGPTRAGTTRVNGASSTREIVDRQREDTLRPSAARVTNSKVESAI